MPKPRKSKRYLSESDIHCDIAAAIALKSVLEERMQKAIADGKAYAKQNACMAASQRFKYADELGRRIWNIESKKLPELKEKLREFLTMDFPFHLKDREGQPVKGIKA